MLVIWPLGRKCRDKDIKIGKVTLFFEEEKIDSLYYFPSTV
ncbi:hypothetical protein CAPGI0001_2222 [Capnocytophaga gingivalis ATCC 33624]|nr:hypothetical protein CAPGI0001_2222 [Capnocytophaga gingivalis ATCC 33624]